MTMKKIIIFIFLIFLLGTQGCSSQKDVPDFTSSDYLEGFDQPNSNTMSWFVPAEDRYYCRDANGYVYYSEKENMHWFLLCGKPQCSHSGFDCNAYIGYTFLFAQYGDRLIYATNAFGIDAYPTYKIYSMAMDGSDRKAIKDLGILKDTSPSAWLHRGHVYYNERNNITGNMKIYDLDITSPDQEAELIFEDIGDVVIFGTGTIINLEVYNNEGLFVYQYDTIGKTMSQVGGDSFLNSDYLHHCLDGSILYEKDGELYRMDPAAMKETVLGPITDGRCYADDDLMYVIGAEPNEGYAISLNQDSAEKTMLPFGSPLGEESYLNMDNDYVFLIRRGGRLPEYYMKKSELLAGNGQWYPMETG